MERNYQVVLSELNNTLCCDLKTKTNIKKQPQLSCYLRVWVLAHDSEIQGTIRFFVGNSGCASFGKKPADHVLEDQSNCKHVGGRCSACEDEKGVLPPPLEKGNNGADLSVLTMGPSFDKPLTCQTLVVPCQPLTGRELGRSFGAGYEFQ